MTWNAEVREALRRHGLPEDDDVVEELAQHAAASFEAGRADGLSADEGAARVRSLIDAWSADPSLIGGRRRRATWDLEERGRVLLTQASPVPSPLWSGLVQDVRYGARLLRRQPGFTVLAVLLIALGVGAATTLGSLSYAVLMKPLPWPDADRIVRIAETREGATLAFGNIVTNGTFLSWRQSPQTIESIASYGRSTVTMTLAGESERFTFIPATASLFDVLRARPIAGTLFTADDEPAGHNDVIVISYGLWQRRFGGRPEAVGATLDLNGDPYRVIGVMPRDFSFPDQLAQGWTPTSVPTVLSSDPRNTQSRTVSLSAGIARLRPGVTPEQASAEATARAIAAPDLGPAGVAMFGTTGKPRVVVVPYLESVTASVRPALYVLLAAVGLLLAAAIANVAGMQLARATTRRREVAIRSALGASSGRLARQLLTENMLIGIAGGLVGWALSIELHRVMPHVLPAGFPRSDEILADWRLFAASIGTSIAASAIFGAVPALVALRLNLVETLTEDSLAPSGGGRGSRLGRLRLGIMTAQVAVAATLLVGALLLTRSFVAMLQADRGYEPRNLLTAALPMGVLKATGPQRAQLLDEIIDGIAHAPGVVAAAGASMMPLWQYQMVMSFQLPQPAGKAPVSVHAGERIVSRDYFRALGLRVIDGRGFTAQDTAASEPVAVVNRRFARLYLPDHAAGTQLPVSFNEHGSDKVRIVGVVEDVHQSSAADPPDAEIYVPYAQLETGLDLTHPVLLVRTTGDPGALIPTVRRIVHDRRPSVVPDSVMTMDERLLESVASPRLYAMLLMVFAAFALLVAGSGLFGVLSYSVEQRTREIGVRSALGARPSQIVGLIVRQAALVTIAGTVAGLGIARALVGLVSGLLFGITTHDPISLIVAPAALVVVATLATLVPARRAARLDPLRALKGTATR